jgi:hypothetical protein
MMFEPKEDPLFQDKPFSSTSSIWSCWNILLKLLICSIEEVGCISPYYTMFTTFKGSISTSAPSPCLTCMVPFSTSTSTPIYMRKSKPSKRSYVSISTTKNTILQTTLLTCTCMSSSLPKAMVIIPNVVLYVSCP